MVTSTQSASRQKVVDGLNLWCTRGLDASLYELGEPVTSDASACGDLTLTQVRLFNQCVCRLKEVHGQSLAKCYPRCKENFTHVTCQNAHAWERRNKIISRQASPPSGRALKCS